jgi:hypothetical protein
MEIMIFFKVLDTLFLFSLLDTIYETLFFNTALYWRASDFILLMMLVDMDPFSARYLGSFLSFLPSFCCPPRLLPLQPPYQTLSPVSRIVKLLGGLDNTMRLRVVKFCTQRDWKFTSDQDAGETLNFDEIKTFLEHKALTMDGILVHECEHRDAIFTFSHSSNTLAVPSLKSPIVTTRDEQRVRFVSQITHTYG